MSSKLFHLLFDREHYALGFTNQIRLGPSLRQLFPTWKTGVQGKSFTTTLSIFNFYFIFLSFNLKQSFTKHQATASY